VRSSDAAHVQSLDGLRGIAILLVMLFHFSGNGHGLTPSSLLVDRMFYRLTGAGWIGVDLFFVLSGFLITGILLDARGIPFYFRNFYVRRALRIFPLYYSALVLLLIMPLMFPHGPAPHLSTRDAGWYLSYLSNVKMARAGWPSDTGLAHFWSLSVEEQFYLAWPVAVFALSNRQLRVACVAAVVGALAVRTALTATGYTIAPYVLMPARIDALAMGGFLAIAMREPRGLPDRVSRWPPIAAVTTGLGLLAVLLFREGLRPDDTAVLGVGLTLVAAFGASVVMLAVGNARAARALSAPWLRFFGKYSYGMYIFHYPILFFGPGVVPIQMLPLVGGSQILRQIAFTTCAMAATTVLALVSWHLLEKRFLELKDRFPYERAISGRHAHVSEPVIA